MPSTGRDNLYFLFFLKKLLITKDTLLNYINIKENYNIFVIQYFNNREGVWHCLK